MLYISSGGMCVFVCDGGVTAFACAVHNAQSCFDIRDNFCAEYVSIVRLVCKGYWLVYTCGLYCLCSEGAQGQC